MWDRWVKEIISYLAGINEKVMKSIQSFSNEILEKKKNAFRYQTIRDATEKELGREWIIKT